MDGSRRSGALLGPRASHYLLQELLLSECQWRAKNAVPSTTYSAQTGALGVQSIQRGHTGTAGKPSTNTQVLDN